MSIYTSPVVMFLRLLGRKTGLNALLSPYKYAPAYEEKFQAELMACIKPGMTVWDVGAYEGHYTKLFADAATSTGHIFAFEPSPMALDDLTGKFASCANVTIVPIALGNQIGETAYEEELIPMGETGRLTIGANPSANAVSVAIATGDSLVEAGAIRTPALAKIDVEGYELEVLKGMSRTLHDRALRYLFIEVHFALLAARGWANAPREIEALLRNAGFHLKWIGPSELIATR